MNEDIRASEVRVLTDRGDQIGVMSKEEAIRMAEEQEKDLILIVATAKPPVVKIIEESKHKYQQQQQKQKQRVSGKGSEIKELRLSPFIAEGDLLARTKRVRKFLENGDKVRLLLRFRGREITKKEFGENVLNKVYEAVEDVARIEIEPKLQGKVMTMQLMPEKKK
ncbi:translation initiation factor IF-3 [Candidatus Woesebacteria bacterium]|nr:translation initiation factor IF-3 [Candidatus Woesebacteria bacterium]MCD8507268.1 translation initiation factor IF-3 [Candidatus Woesebacteria bacterium]MCD8526598.1 translation initiation factor IF-3 [Candidatus Woesebacteria bacterium]MCD8545991.1 translation initiation factor IF-3 [Candidatus Woesebacteria bacterium]